MPYPLENKFKIGVSSRALFQLEHENSIFENEGIDAYERYQIAHEENVLLPGAAFALVQALQRLNRIESLTRQVEIFIMSRNSANTSLRVFHSIKAYDLQITRGIFTGGRGLASYLDALNIDLFLTANPQDAQAAIDEQIPAATIMTENIPAYDAQRGLKEIRIAFDGDAVLFSEEAEKIYQEQGLEAFTESEVENARNPLAEGPFARLLRLLSDIQRDIRDEEDVGIRTALITARSSPTNERVVRTLRAWNVQIDESFFLGGISKTEILKAFGAHIFFDDQTAYTLPASGVVPSATVPYRTGSAMDQLSQEKGEGS